MNEGNRILPPMSEPIANGTPHAETMHPAPPELPPINNHILLQPATVLAKRIRQRQVTTRSDQQLNHSSLFLDHRF